MLDDAPTVTSMGPGTLDVYVLGIGRDLHHKWFSNGWSSWEWLGGHLYSAPAAVSWGPGRMDVFYRSFDLSLRQSSWNNGW